MKVFLLIIAFASMALSASIAQSVPQGMKYQAVARDNSGQIIPNQKISLKIALLTSESSNSYYSEIHDVTTSELGLFTLVVGGGKADKGLFKDVPWSTQDIWMQVSIAQGTSKAFTVISNSKLLAVPYAFHAATASQLVGNASAREASSILGANASSANGPGVPSQNWSLFGNSKSNALVDKLGTTDYVDLVVVTNNLERLRVYANGNIDIKRSLDIGANLNVDSSVNLNKISGVTTSNGPFIVGTSARKSPTILNGTLTVEKDQATVLGGTLAVDKAAQLNSTLTVAGVTNLNNSLNVNNASPTLLSGTLRVNGDAAFKKIVRIDSTLNSDTTLKNGKRVIPNGALVVMGGVGIDSNLSVNGDARFGGKATFSGAVAISDGTASTSPNNGALTVAGGVGVGKQLNVNGSVKFNDSLTVGGLTTLNDSLVANGRVIINASGITGNDNNYNSYPLQVQGGRQGIAIKINESRTSANNFVTFWDKDGIQGRIEGQTKAEMYDDNDYKTAKAGYVYDVAAGSIDLFFATTDLYFTATNTVAAATSATACLGLGACVTSPIPSLIASSASQVVVALLQEAFVIAGIAVAAVNLNDFIDRKDAQVGVSYQSGGADYAEYLKRSNQSEKMQPGDVVGVIGGQITKNTSGAEKIMVVSHRPIVLGNMPKPGEEVNYEKVAFMGQVPVRVFGKVDIGDYIIASGKNDGVGIPVKSAALQAEDMKRIVGIAWSSAPTNLQFNMINVAVGIGGNDISKVVSKLEDQVKKQQADFNDLRGGMAQTVKILEEMIPGFNQAMKSNTATAQLLSMPVSSEQNRSVSNSITSAAKEIDSNFDKESVFTAHPNESNIVYHKIARQDVLNGFEMAEKELKESGLDLSHNNFWKQLQTNPSFKEGLITGIQKKFEKELCAHKIVNKHPSLK